MLVPMTTAVHPDGYERDVPDVMMAPASVNVCPSMIKLDEASAVYVDPSNVKIGAVVTPLWPSGYVLVPTVATLPPDASEVAVPDTVIAAPGARVWLPITYWPLESAE